VSALRRLSVGTRPSRHAAVLRSFRTTIESYVPSASPWVNSRFRDFLSTFPPAVRPAMLPSTPPA
jgi:hypothetical protein